MSSLWRESLDRVAGGSGADATFNRKRGVLGRHRFLSARISEPRPMRGSSKRPEDSEEQWRGVTSSRAGPLGANVHPPLVLGEKVWCSACGDYVKVVRVTSAAKIVNVDRRTIFNYVRKKKVFAVRVAGSTLRVCSSCLLRGNDVSQVDDCITVAATAIEIREVARR